MPCNLDGPVCEVVRPCQALVQRRKHSSSSLLGRRMCSRPAGGPGFFDVRSRRCFTVLYRMGRNSGASDGFKPILGSAPELLQRPQSGRREIKDMGDPKPSSGTRHTFARRHPK